MIAALAAAVLFAACGGGDTAPTPPPADASGQPADGPQSEPVLIRMALAPDPIWRWLEDSGTVAQWEAAHNIRIEATNPFDQFSAFAGGHVDVVVINALEVPQFVEQSNREPVIIGKLSSDRSILAVRRTSSATTLENLIEARISVDNDVGSALLWGIITEAIHGLDFRVDSADFDLVVVESASVTDLVMREDVEACVCLPDFSVPALADGLLRPLYGGRPAAQIFAEDLAGLPNARPVAAALVTDQVWLAQNRGAVDALLGIWEVGLQHWASHKQSLIEAYPHLLSVKTDEEVRWITDYVRTHDWVSPTVYLNEEDSSVQSLVFDRMQHLGLVPEGAREPELDLSHSAASREG